MGIFKLYSKSPQKRRELFNKILLPYVLYNQIWLNLLVDGCQFGYRYPKIENQGVCHTMALPFTLKSILRQREELRKLKIFTMEKYNLQKILSKTTKILRKEFSMIPRFNTSQNVIFQKPSYQNRSIIT